jgi:hypothetical protein
MVTWSAAFAIGVAGLSVATIAVSASGAFDEPPPETAPPVTAPVRPPVRPARAIELGKTRTEEHRPRRETREPIAPRE